MMRDVMRERDVAETELAEWHMLRLWGTTPEIVHAFIKCQQARIHAAQEEYEELTKEREKVRVLRLACERLRDCDWVISLPDRMDAVRDIARAALAATAAAPPPTAPSPTETRPN
jgi:hypothetical protein